MDFPYLKGLNEVQRDAVLNTQGPSLIIAGAGSGKTRVLTYRIAHMMHTGVKASSILALTFTNKAAREMKDRISSVVGYDTAKYLWMGTFHSVFSRLLRMESESIGFSSNFTIYDSSDSKSVIRSILKDMQLDDKIYKVNTVLGRISEAKNNLVTATAYYDNNSAREYDASVRMPKIADIYKEYSRRCKVSDAMDFDDLLLYTNMLIHRNSEILAKYQQHFKYILVDEYQDTNLSQYFIIKKLAESHHNICVVGDDAQSIYSFRGARIENILNFQKDYPEFKIFKLEQNYRSTQSIVNAANSVISKNKRQINKTAFSQNESGDVIKVMEAITDNEEGQIVANELNSHRLSNQQNFSDYAILYRTNAQSRIFEESLRKMNIPYKIHGGLSFYERKEIKDLLSYLRMTINPNDNEAVKRVINFPARGIGDTTLSRIEQTSTANEISIWKVITNPVDYPSNLSKGTWTKIIGFTNIINELQSENEGKSAYEMAILVARQSGLLAEMSKGSSPEEISKFENIQELLNSIQDFSVNALEEGRPNGLGDYLQDVALITDQDNEKDDDNNKVKLMTIHSVKGLEFKNVFIVGVEEKLLPANFNGFLSENDIEEERRLFYVAITRAMKKVWISYSRQRYSWGKLNFCEPSRFIEDIDSKYLEMPSSLDQPSFLYKPKSFSNFSSSHQPERPQQAPKHYGGIPTSAQPVQKKGPEVRRPASVPPSQFSQHLSTIKQAMGRPSFQADDPSLIKAGLTVEHQRFGRGSVLEVEGEDQNKKATVLFKNAGRKQLLLKFAGLKIVED